MGHGRQHKDGHGNVRETAMKRSIAGISAVGAVASLLFAASSHSHHSVAVGFDMQRRVTVTGTILDMEWINPHARMSFEVEDENGETQTWVISFTSANNLFRRGWRSTHLPVGATITVSGFPARDGSNELYAGETRLADGSTLFGGNAPGEC